VAGASLSPGGGAFVPDASVLERLSAPPSLDGGCFGERSSDGRSSVMIVGTPDP
jgi:hypothetical protein